MMLFGNEGCAQKNNGKITDKSGKATMQLSDDQWKDKLTPEQYYILREKGTERAFSGKFVFTKEKGSYKCAGCGEPLFTDEMKFESHCGWPSFDREVAGGKIIQTEDNSHGMKRTEITCARCGGHLGHIFEDGPTETGKRYCVNSGALTFEESNAKDIIVKNDHQMLTLGGGCFWCIEAVFEELKGVIKVVSGYSGGHTDFPTYKDVSSGKTGHAEVVQITYDENVISTAELLEVFFTIHDATTLNRQGADIGNQYRSVIFYHTTEQKSVAENIINELNKNQTFDADVVTQLHAFDKFYPAENYHQEYYELNKEEPYCRAVIRPKLDKLKKVFSKKLK